VGYRLRKLVRRRRGAFAAAAAVVALVAALSAVHTVRLRRERDRARAESERAREVTALLSQLFAGADPNRTRGATLTLRDFLGEAPARAAAIADPRVRADVLHILGDALLRSGSERAAIEPLGEALRQRRAELATKHPDTGRTMTVLGAARGQIGEKPAGRRLLRTGIAVLEASLGEMAPDLVWPLDRLALLVYEHDDAAADALVRRALRIHAWNGTALADRAYLLQHRAVFARGMGDNRRGAALYLRSYDVAIKTLGPESPIAATALCNAARTYNELGESRRALAMQREAQAIHERAWAGADNVQLAGCLRAGAEILVYLDQLDEAWQLAERAHGMNLRLYGEEHLQTMNMVALLGWVAEAQGRLDLAAELCTRFLDFQRRQGIPENAGWAYSHIAIARQRLARGDRAGAEELARHALGLLREALEPGEAALVPALVLVGEITALRDRAAAAPVLREAATIADAELSPELRDHRLAREALARFEGRASEREAADGAGSAN
jgi:serine/threonine-protein kinase